MSIRDVKGDKGGFVEVDCKPSRKAKVIQDQFEGLYNNKVTTNKDQSVIRVLEDRARERRINRVAQPTVA